MARGKTVPSEVLRMALAEQGEVEALRRLGRLILPGNATEDILEILFKWITAIPVSISSIQMNKFVSSSGVGARPSVALCAFWKPLHPADHSEMKLEMKLLLIQHLMESGDAVLGWTRVCLQSGPPTVAEDMLNTGPFLPRAKSYLSPGHSLSCLVRLDKDYTAVVLSSRTFINLCLELRLAEDYCNQTGKLVFRMLDCKAVFGCPTPEMVDKILSNDQSREMLLAHFKNKQQRARFAAALTDRAVRGWHHTKIPMLAWHHSLQLNVSITAHLSNTDPLFRQQFARASHTTQLCARFHEFVTGLPQTDEAKFLLSKAVSGLSTLMQLARR
ncbi:hypothetical protein FA13DRAFT_1794074 [Coprinellus micaceus]|uniref:Uncharacterized protein n=1 Tax=Coprinellus micaceus TaxID=71717 RepID=A0A4Y7T2H8_COPMI|nr:hypothetical protein FA13DRAFT_1794074 [Coprinellus micaceus]